MKKNEYFFRALKAEAWRYRVWQLGAFAVTMGSDKPVDKPFPYQLQIADGVHQFWNTETNEWEPIEDGRVGVPLFDFAEQFEILPAQLPNVAKKEMTNYGNAFFNAVALCWPFGATVPYYNKRGGAKDIEKLFIDRIVEDPEGADPFDRERVAVDPAKIPAGKVCATQVWRHLDVMFDIIGNMALLCSQTASEGILTVAPEVIALRDRLLEENKDRLSDLSVVADIIKQVVEADKASLKDDPAFNFLYSGKAFDVVRLRTQIMHGVEHSFEQDGSFALITRSLAEGWDFQFFAEMNNSSRDGSFNRGALTALGGEAVKFFYRRYQNSKLIAGDCGTKIYIPRRIDRTNYRRVIGNSYVEQGRVIKITADVAEKLLGKVVEMRDPGGCIAGGFDYCEICFGDVLKNSPDAIANIMADVASQMMYIFMKKMHGTAIKTAYYDFKLALS